MIKQPKLMASEMVLNCSNMKKELYDSIDHENHRTNVDSAKKRAVMQGFDYDGFRQMVLGADIFPIKSKDFQQVLTYKRGDTVINRGNIVSFDKVKLDVNKEQDEQDVIKTINEIKAQILKEYKVVNFREFKKKFDVIYSSPLDQQSAINIYQLIQIQTQDDIKKIFNMEFDLQYFMKIIIVFEYLCLNEFFQEKNSHGLGFILKFLQDLMNIKEFKQQVPMFLNKKEKLSLKTYFTLLETEITDQYDNFYELKTFLDQAKLLYIKE